MNHQTKEQKGTTKETNRQTNTRADELTNDPINKVNSVLYILYIGAS